LSPPESAEENGDEQSIQACYSEESAQLNSSELHASYRLVPVSAQQKAPECFYPGLVIAALAEG
jgi:hypothetical protein